MMTAIDILTKDHRKVAALFDEIERADDRGSIFRQIFDELTVHSEAEETFFYPELELSSETSGEVAHSYHEHKEVKELLADLAARDPNDAEFMSVMKELRQNVEHHVQEEEGELFPKAVEVLGEAKLADIGTKIQALKKSKQSNKRAA